ncbi:MAG: copper homeostasis protein CutC [Prevotellaceae bacterium]|jgi:copper homeostasis protein|nr:copper homeostasis protein CutC [Prevotellaceae bacterium]
MYLIEVCAGSVQSAIEAEKGGAGRIELCDNLFEGGTTPSAATIQMTCEKVKIPVYVIIRPRGGDFLYSDLEFEIMKREVSLAQQYGAAGIVTGLLCADGSVDEVRTSEMVALARRHGIGFTFHRAFDMTRDYGEALEAVIRTGCERILTSGGENKAFDGRNTLKRMVEQSAGRILIMAGSGVNSSNIKELIESTGVDELHLSGKRRISGGMIFRNEKIRMGGLPQIPEYDIEVTDAAAIAGAIAAADF